MGERKRNWREKELKLDIGQKISATVYDAFNRAAGVELEVQKCGTRPSERKRGPEASRYLLKRNNSWWKEKKKHKIRYRDNDGKILESKKRRI